MGDVAIRVQGLGKQYRIGGPQAPYKTFRDELVRLGSSPMRLLRAARPPENTIWALDDVTFEIKKGEAVGIIGRNGAGKSTLLKILSRITKPTRGRVDLYGRVGSLLEVGTGFHPELTGRENIYLNGAILGMTRREIQRKFDEIVDFAEIEKFLDTPVKHYSSGMYVRLAFAVAAHLEPEILLVDEVLAVGDAQFQKKSLGKMGAVAREGRTVLFVSHSMSAVSALCSRGLLISTGRLFVDADVNRAVDSYLQQVSAVSAANLAARGDRQGDGRLRFSDFHLEDEKGERVEQFVSGREGRMAVSYQAESAVQNVVVSIGISGAHGQFLLLCNNEIAGYDFESLPPRGLIRCSLPVVPFAAGSFRVNLFCTLNGIIADWVQEAATLNVMEGDFYGTGRSSPQSHGGFLAKQEWSSGPIA